MGAIAAAAAALLDVVMVVDAAFSVAGKEPPSDRLTKAADEFFNSSKGKQLAGDNIAVGGIAGYLKMIGYEKSLQDKLVDALMGDAKQEAQQKPNDRALGEKVATLAAANESLRMIEDADNDWAKWLEAHAAQRETFGKIGGDDGDVYVYDQLSSKLFSVHAWKRTDFNTSLMVTGQDNSLANAKSYRSKVLELGKEEEKVAQFIVNHRALQQAGLKDHSQDLEMAASVVVSISTKPPPDEPVVIPANERDKFSRPFQPVRLGFGG